MTLSAEQIVDRVILALGRADLGEELSIHSTEVRRELIDDLETYMKENEWNGGAS